MPFDAESLALLIAASGGPETEAEDLDQALARQLFRQELGREADSVTSQSILTALRAGMSTADVRGELRASYELFVKENHLAGQLSDAFRRLSAYSSIEGLTASGVEIAESIATYRLLLGREPEPAGFATFVTSRRANTLAVVVRDTAGTLEAAQYFAPDPPPAIPDAVLAIASLAAQILHAVAADATLGATNALGGTVRDLVSRVSELEQQMERFIEVVLLRLDAETTR